MKTKNYNLSLEPAATRQAFHIFNELANWLDANLSIDTWHIWAEEEYTLQASDNGCNIGSIHVVGSTLIIPEGLPIGLRCRAFQLGGILAISTEGESEINGSQAGITFLGQWKSVYLSQYAPNKWVAEP